MQLAGWHNQISNNALLNRAAGSNLRMVRPSLMSVVKLPIICARNTRQNLDLFLAVRRRAHFTSASNWELPLLCSLSLTCTERMCTHLRLYPAGFYYSRERDHTKVKCIISYVLAQKQEVWYVFSLCVDNVMAVNNVTWEVNHWHSNTNTSLHIAIEVCVVIDLFTFWF